MKGIQLVTELTKWTDNVKLFEDQIVVGSDYHQYLNCPSVTTGAGTPEDFSLVPTKVGDIFIDTSANKFYMAKAATAHTDFIMLN